MKITGYVNTLWNIHKIVVQDTNLQQQIFTKYIILTLYIFWNYCTAVSLGIVTGQTNQSNVSII